MDSTVVTKEKEGRKERKEKKKLVLCLKILHISILLHTHVHKQTSSLYLSGTYLEMSSWLFYQRYWTYPSVSIFFTHFIQKRILKNNRKGMRRKKKCHYMETKRKKSSLRKKGKKKKNNSVKYVKRERKTQPSHHPSCTGQAKRPFLTFLCG